MKTLWWKIRFAYFMWRRTRSWKSNWMMAGAWVEQMDWQDESPLDCVDEELSYWSY